MIKVLTGTPALNGSSGVQSVTGDGVNNTDPKNPILSFPNTSEVSETTDKNYVTDAEKTVLGNTSGTNTGDETTGSIQTKRPLKTVGGTSIEGSGDIPIPDTATWGGISGTLSDQTDLQAELDLKLNESANPSKTEKGAIKAFYDATTSTLEISIDGVDIP